MLNNFNLNNQCEVTGCYTPAYKYSRYCQRHARHQNRTGHPTRGNLKSNELKDWLRLAKDVCEKHPEEIQLLSQWFNEQMANSKPYDPYIRSRTPKTTEFRLNQYLYNLKNKDTPEVTLVARTVAVLSYQEYAFRERFGNSDEFLYVQLGGVLFKTRSLPGKWKVVRGKHFMDKHGDMALKPRKAFGKSVYAQSQNLRPTIIPEVIQRYQKLSIKRKRNHRLHGENDGPKRAMVTKAKNRPQRPRDGVIWIDPKNPHRRYRWNESMRVWAQLV